MSTCKYCGADIEFRYVDGRRPPEVCFFDEIGFARERLKQIVTTRSARAHSVHQGWV